MNWKIYEWIGVQIFFGKIYEWIGRYIRMNCGSDFFSEGKIYEWIGRYTNELGFRFFFGIIFIYFIFSIGRLGFWNLKIYEWIGRYTNELGFGFFFGRYTNELEDIRMNWGSDFCLEGKNYEWIGRYTNELGFRFFFKYIRMNWGLFWRKLWKFNKINEIN